MKLTPMKFDFTNFVAKVAELNRLHKLVHESSELRWRTGKTEGWVSDPPKHNNLRRLLVNVTARDNNSVWRKTAAYSCMFLLDFPLSVVYTCTGGILAIPAFHWE